MSYIGDFALGSTFDKKFTTVNTSGVPTTLAGTPVVSAYVDNSVTEITAGITLTVDFDARTGMHNVRVVATSGNGYAAGSNYQLVITTGTVGGSSVVGYVIAEFSIEARSALRPTTSGRTLVVDAAGLADANVVKLGPTGTGAAQTARDIGASVLLSPGTGAGQLDITSGVVKANLAQILGTALTETAGQIAAAFKQFFDVATPTGTMKAITNVVTTTNLTNLPSIPANWITAAGINAGAITNAKFAAGAIDAAAIADAAIDRATFAADTGLQSIRSNTAQAGAAGSITLDAAASATDSFYNGCLVYLTGGTGVGQYRVITGYTGATKVATVTPNWVTNPDVTSTFAVVPLGMVSVEAWLRAVAPANTGDAFARLGVPVGASISADIAGVQADTDNIQTRIPAALVSGRIDASVGAMAANVITAASTAADFLAEVNAEVVDALNVDTYAEPGQATPPATASLVAKIGYLYKNWRNRKTQTATTWSLYNDDATTVDQKSTVSDDGTTADKTEVTTGP